MFRRMRPARHHRFIRLTVVLVAAAVFALSACSTSSDKGEPTATSNPAAPSNPTTTVAPPALPRYATDGIRLTASAEQPLFVYNVYPSGAQPELINDVVKLWPEDLLAYLAIQIVPNDMEKLSDSERAEAIDAMLDASDAARVPVILQTLTLFGSRAPSPTAIDTAFEEHPSLVGLGVAELSADFQTALAGLQATQADALAATIRTATRHDGIVLWADMGYFGPQVFVSAGADKNLYDLMREHHRNMIVQVKQNGSGRRFGAQSAAFGLYLAGLADTWGLNSEDWLWWEASLQRLGDDQVPGGLTAVGMTRSEFQIRARLTYPEALFGTEMLTIAAAGGSVFSIEKPERGTIDPGGTGKVSPAGLQVVFPVLRRLVHNAMIPDRATVQRRVGLAFKPSDKSEQALALDEVFSRLYGPEGCTDGDRLTCSQRQWLPSTGIYGIVPTLPVLAGDDVSGRFARVLTPTAALAEPAATLSSAAATTGPQATGTSWAAPAVDGVWFVANPHENNVDTTTNFTLPALNMAGQVQIGGTLCPYDFAIVDGRSGGLSILVDNFRTDSDRLWDDNISEADLANKPLDALTPAPPDTTVLTFTYPKGSERPNLQVTGATSSDQSWDVDRSELKLTIRHRGPVTITPP